MTDPKSRSRERFAAHAHAYVTSESHAGGEDLEAVVRLADARPEWVALDVATGGGHTAIAIAPFVAGMVALDLTPEMLDAARGLAAERDVAGIEFVLGDAEALPFPDASFDLVTCRIAAHHFPDVQAFADAVARVLRPGGRFVLHDQCVPDNAAAATFVNLFERLRDPSHQRSLAEGAWREVLRRANLEIEAVEHFEKRMSLETWSARQGCTPQTVTQLRELLADAGETTAAWMAAEGEGSETTFTIHQVVIAASKG
ncbi:MAG: methyltransferase domain-containing protein [Actinomycetota bacterium]|nr:MAG: methyltransferase type [Actinomycetota bacterium]MDO8949847.1 methyltransferase domain-containing protein [Actinomycetota bacterium]MDP3629429.1 methyltransferase domain-containing protein [Actinomycetota bacterium]